MPSETLTRLFDETVEYRLPKAQEVGAIVDTSVRGEVLRSVRDTYLEVNRALYNTDKYSPDNPFENTIEVYKINDSHSGETTKSPVVTAGGNGGDPPEGSNDKLTKMFGPKYLLPPNYVAAVDAFYPEMAHLLFESDKGIEMMTLPVSHASAFYIGEDRSLAIDTMAIPGTPKNMWAQNLYKSALDVVDRLVRSNPRVYGGLRNLKGFYNGILNELSSTRRMKKTLVHEMSHHVLQEEGLAPYLTSPMNEGLTENLTEEITGEQASLEGTTYHDFKTRVRSAVSRFTNSTKGFLKRYRERGKALIDQLYGQSEVKPLVSAVA